MGIIYYFYEHSTWLKPPELSGWLA